MSGWLMGFLVVAGLLVAAVIWGFIIGRKEERESEEEYQQQKREREERGRQIEEQQLQAAVRHRQELKAATLHGTAGESIEKAAKRLGIDLRLRTETEWLGRQGNDAFRAPLSGEPRPVFYKIDPNEPVEIPSNAFSKEGGSWKVLDTVPRDKPYHQQLYDGDDFEWHTIAVDEIGRRIEIKHGTTKGVWAYHHNDSEDWVPHWEW